MREIKFRGERVDNKEWIDGYLFVGSENIAIMEKGKTADDYTHAYILQEGFADWNLPKPLRLIEVDINTAGQFTGLHDKNGVEIYEGDVVRIWGGEQWHGKWEFDDTETITDIRYMESLANFNFEGVEVIGNIYDNPELLGGYNVDML